MVTYNMHCYHTIILILFNCTIAISATSVQMRVVKDTASYGYFGNNIGGNENNPVTPAASPANFSGPVLLQRLLGKCYNLTQNQYQYTFCPFHNFSQYELSSRWNAYHGVLGIWSHWDIKNNTFTSMIFNHGDRCGDIERSVQVDLECGSREVLTNVTEPSRCHYLAKFQSKYLCHKDSLLVYPRLSSNLRKKWDQLLTEFQNGDITEKGYQSSLKKLFQSANLLEKEKSESPNEKLTTEISSHQKNVFSDLTTCNKEYKNIVQEITRLNQELDSLKLLLDLSKLESRTRKPLTGDKNG